jgi:hypothetical protein
VEQIPSLVIHNTTTNFISFKYQLVRVYYSPWQPAKSQNFQLGYFLIFLFLHALIVYGKIILIVVSILFVAVSDT